MAKEAAAEKPLVTIEELAKGLCSPSELAGMKQHYGWAEGLAMTRDDFIAARDAWLKGPIAGSTKGGNKQ
ncbi:hypothetical protein JCM15765_02600 [Paradesulfitobacterium aromaticivorans]